MRAPLRSQVHGSGDGFPTPGVGAGMGASRAAASEASTFVVVRVAVDRAKYPWLSVVGVDPFTKAELVRMPATMIDATYDVRMPRGTFADHPNTEFRFYATEGDARAGAPALVVYYHGVPDTAPEFAGRRASLSQYLRRSSREAQMTRAELARMIDHSVLKPESTAHDIAAGADVRARLERRLLLRAALLGVACRGVARRHRRHGRSRVVGFPHGCDTPRRQGARHGASRSPTAPARSTR